MSDEIVRKNESDILCMDISVLKNTNGKMMLGSRFMFVLLGTILGTVGVLLAQYTIKSDGLSGEKFAQSLIALANHGNGIVKLGNPENILQRICFEPNGASGGKSLAEFFPNMTIAYHETDDSNLWYVGFFSPEQGGLVILGIPHNELRWNDYSSTQAEKNLDSQAKSGCFAEAKITEIKITDSPNTTIRLFRPIYQTMWRK